jgi:protein-L-isoaspartate(D-aspartate) O-methyltransferase
MVSFAAARRMMVDGQVRTNDVTDIRIIGAFEDVPRERFVPPQLVDLAYLDRDLAVTAARPGAPARYLIKPMVLAKLVQALDLGAADKVLDVGCASGYSAAIVAHVAGAVVALEEDAALAAQAAEILRAAECGHAIVRTGALPEGAPADGPYDAILIEGAVEFVPPQLCAQLKEGGRLVCVLKSGGALGKAMLYRWQRGELSGRPLFDASAPLLAGFVRPPAFVF